MNKFDHVTGFLTGSLISILYVTGSITGGVAHLLVVVGIIFVVTSVVSYCSLSPVIETSSNKNK